MTAARPLALVVTLLAVLMFVPCASPDAHHRDGSGDRRPAAVSVTGGQSARHQGRAGHDDVCCHHIATLAPVRLAAGTGLPADQLTPAAVAGAAAVAAPSGGTPRPLSVGPRADDRVSLMVWRI